jgi:hypothetical protein
VETLCGFRLNLICCELQFCLRTAGTCNEETGNGQKNFKHLSGMLQRYNRDFLGFGTKVRFAARITSVRQSQERKKDFQKPVTRYSFMNNMTSNISTEFISQLPNLNANNLEYKYFIKTESLKQNQV